MSHRRAVLSLYRQALRLAQEFPAGRREGALAEVRSEFRRNKTAGEDAAAGLLKSAAGKVRFLSSMYGARKEATSSGGVSRFVLDDSGKLVEVEEEGEVRKRRASIGSMKVDAATLSRHRELVKRQYFMGKDRMR